MTETADFLVIGGGIAGIGAAARLTADAKAIVLDMEDAIGRHSTGRSAAIYLRNYGNATLRVLNDAAAPIFLNPEGISDQPILTPRGELMIAYEDELPTLEAYLDGAEGMDRISPAEAVELFPILKPDPIVAAAIEPTAQNIDVDLLLQGFARMLKRQGGEIVLNAAAQKITRKAGVWRVETPAGVFEAPVLVNAAGAWADRLAETAGVKTVGLQAYRRSMAVLPAPEGYEIDRWPLLVSASETWYCKPEAGKLYVSPADEDPVDPHDAWPEDMVLAEGLDRFEQAVTMTVTRVERSWAGLRTFAKDRTPVVGFDPGAEGFFWLAGQGGYGVQTAPALSQLAADLCLGRAPSIPERTVAELSPARFAAV